MIRKPLGRGLDALIESTAPASPTVGDGSAVKMVPVGRIAPAPFQPRQHFDPERLAELKSAILSQGVIEPLIVRPKPDSPAGDASQYELIAGERRLRAARDGGLEAVPVVVRVLDDRSALEMSLVENLAREELNALEEGRAFTRLSQEFGLGHDEIAARIGKSRPYVSNAIRLLDLPEPVLGMIARGELSPGQARPLLALPSAGERLAAARRIVERGLSARGAEELVSARRSSNGVAPRNQSAARPDPNLSALAERLQRALKRKVRIVRRRGKSPGRIEIEYYGDNDLTGLAATLIGERPVPISV
jgi:ParB family transcriptional regulator, chromosome partitioning protein